MCVHVDGCVLTYGQALVLTPLVEMTVFSSWMCLCTFLKNQLYLYVYFWTLSSALIVYVSGFIPIPHYLDYCGLLQNKDITHEGEKGGKGEKVCVHVCIYMYV